MEQSERRRARRVVVGHPEDAVDVMDILAVEARSQAPVDVLDRDQRTVRVVVRDSRTRASSPPTRSRRLSRTPSKCCEECSVCQVCDYHQHSVLLQRPPQCRIYSSPFRCSSRSSSSWFPVGSVIRWFLVAVCVLSLASPRAMAAPAGRSERDGHSVRPQHKWLNPCSLNKGQVVGEQELEYQGESAASIPELILRIVTSSKHALDHAKNFRVSYVETTFEKDYDEHHNLWKSYKYNWLPDIPKELGEAANKDHLQKQKLEEALKDVYLYLQKYAVGLEQIVIDQKKNQGPFLSKFDHQEHLLRNVLCEVQVVMQEQGVIQHPDVSPEIMNATYRDSNMNSSFRNLRDWIILREYMNGLEYIIELLNHMSEQ